MDSEKEIKGFTFGYATPNMIAEDKHPKYVRQKGPEFFTLDEGYTNLVDSYSIPDGTLQQQATGVIHFGYLGIKSNVSYRVANESALVAKLANTVYGQGVQPKLLCSTAKLRSCPNFDTGNSGIKSKVDGDFYVSACMMEVCPERARELKDTFGPFRSRQYKAKHDVSVQIYQKGTVKAGSVITGIFEKNFGMMFYKPRPFEMLTDAGERAYMKPQIHSSFLSDKTTWEDDFEEIQ